MLVEKAFIQNPAELNEEISLLRELQAVERMLKGAREHAV
jgi:hypothetical protein